MRTITILWIIIPTPEIRTTTNLPNSRLLCVPAHLRKYRAKHHLEQALPLLPTPVLEFLLHCNRPFNDARHHSLCLTGVCLLSNNSVAQLRHWGNRGGHLARMPTQW